MDNVGFDYSADLEEIKGLLDSVNQGLLAVHNDLSRILWIVIFLALALFVWSIIKNIRY